MSGSLPRGSLSDMLGFDPQQVQPNELLARIQRNPVGLNQFAPSAGNPSAGFDPVVGVWNGQPVTAGQAAALPVNPLTGSLNPSGEVVANALLGLGSEVRAAGSVAKSLKVGYDPPSVPARNIEVDYPQGVPADATGRITHDIEGRPLAASHVAGWSRAHPDVGHSRQSAIPVSQYDAISEGAIGSVPTGVAPREIGGDAGRLRRRAGPDGDQYNIYYRNDLNPGQRVNVAGHELGHVVDELSSHIPTDGLTRELHPLYSRLWTNEDRTKKLTRPRDVTYSLKEEPRELMAEAVRAYIQNPDWLKQVAPQTAARIREYVNENPRLNKVIQFNSAAGLLGAGVAAGGGSSE